MDYIRELGSTRQREYGDISNRSLASLKRKRLINHTFPQALIEQQRMLGKSIKTFCQEHGLSAGYFYSVKSKLKIAKPTPSRFLTLKSIEQNYSPTFITHHKNVHLSIFATTSSDWITELIKGLNP